MRNSKTYVFAALAGIGTTIAMWLAFPIPSFLQVTEVSGSEEPSTSALTIQKTNNPNAKAIPPELINKHHDLGYAIAQVEIRHIGKVLCTSQSPSPTKLIVCNEAKYTANITRSSADSIARDFLTAYGNQPYDYLTGSSYSFEFAVEGRGAYLMTISVL